MKQEQAQAAAERAAREEKEREAKALENYHGPRWWERGRLVSGVYAIALTRPLRWWRDQ